MATTVYRYRFDSDVSIADIESSIVLAIFAVESLHGEAQVRLDASHVLDPKHRTCVVDATTEVGSDLNRVFAQFLRREFGDSSFRVERIDKQLTGKLP